MRTAYAPAREPLTRRKLAPLLVAFAACAATGNAIAAALYDAGPLNFSTVNQSMWGTGNAPVFKDSVFVGPQWTNSTVGVGTIVGSVGKVSVNTNPLWWAWKACKETVNVFCGDQPNPGTISDVVDTRTGARVELTTSGKFGLEFGYTVNSGTVNAATAYSATAILPDGAKQGDFFNLNPDSKLTGASLSSQSPEIEAHINAIAQLSGSVSAQACLILTGCTPKGTLALPTLNLDQNVLAIDPNSIKVLDELLPPANAGEPRQPLAEVKLANQTLTLQAAVAATGTPGFKLTTSQFTILDTTGGVPGVTIDLASIEFKLPNIATSGGLTSSGRDDIVKLRADIDGLAFAVGSGTIPPLGLGLTLIDAGGFKVGMQLDALDIDIGPDIGITQDFELTPTLMARLDFDRPVMIAGLNGPRNFWEGEWDLLPDIALLETTTFTPTFWLDAILTNTIGIDLGLTGNWDIYKFAFTAQAGPVTILESTPISLNRLLGLGNVMFSTPKLEFPIWDRGFQLQGFDAIRAASFIITVPTPGTLALLLAALGAGAFARRGAGAQRGAKPSVRH